MRIRGNESNDQILNIKYALTKWARNPSLWAQFIHKPIGFNLLTHGLKIKDDNS